METFFQMIFGLAVLVNALVFVSSLDDAFIDAYFWLWTLRRRLTVHRKHARLRLESLHDRAETPFVIMVPAWKEFDVIAKMIENTNATMEYLNFQIFVGTYINDGETRAEVDRMARRYQNVHRVDVPHFGPTCKADCLNSIVQAVFQHEAETGCRFSGFVIHDSEDVIHPMELRAFNYLIDRMDLIQLPVLSLERDWNLWVAGTYQDDFAECHSKDMVVRESFTGLVPCAGTGMCYSHRALSALSEETGGSPFNVATLTEDYDFSFRLMKFGMKQAFVKIPFRYTARERGIWGERSRERYDLLGVREYFPSSFRAAYRQRARWILGIGLQGWESLGWQGDLKARYFMFRDRKGLFTSLINILGYFLLAVVGTTVVLGWLHTGAVTLPAGFGPGSWLTRLMQVNAVFMANRVLQRFIFVHRLYGLLPALLSIPRVIVGNLVNFAAAVRAWRLYLTHRITGSSLVWDKTVHVYPSGSEMQPFRSKLGEILLLWNELDERDLEAALTEQRTSGQLLGSILVERWGLTETQLADAIAFQASLPRSVLSMPSLIQNQNLLPHPLAIHQGWVPLGIGEKEELLLGVSTPPSQDALAAALEHLRVAPKFFILTESETACALAYLVLGGASLRTLDPVVAVQLGRFLDVKVGISPANLREALATYSHSDHGSLPAFLEHQDFALAHPVQGLQSRRPSARLLTGAVAESA